MSHAIRFDTLAYANRLKEAGVPEKQAEAQSEALAEVLDSQIATKKDLLELEANTKKDLVELEANTKKDLVELEARLSARIDNKTMEMKIDLIKWMVGLLFAQTALLTSLFKLLH
jgi:hypothetical protein